MRHDYPFANKMKKKYLPICFHFRLWNKGKEEEENRK